MISLTVSPNMWHRLAALFAFAAHPIMPDAAAAPSDETRKAEQEVYHDMIWSNPGVIASELGACHMILMCGSRR